MTAERKAKFFFGVDLRHLDVDPDFFDPYLGPLPGNEWPAHITVCPPVLEIPGVNPERLFVHLGDAVSKLTEYDVYPKGDASFDGSTRVTLIDGGQPLHLMAIGALETHGYHGQYPREFIGPDYTGHTSHLEGALPPRQPIRVKSVTVYRNVDGLKFADRRFMLKKNDY